MFSRLILSLYSCEVSELNERQELPPLSFEALLSYPFGGPVGEKERMPIHRKAPTYEELATTNELLETGIKVIDLVCPFAKGGKVGLSSAVRASERRST